MIINYLDESNIYRFVCLYNFKEGDKTVIYNSTKTYDKFEGVKGDVPYRTLAPDQLTEWSK